MLILAAAIECIAMGLGMTGIVSPMLGWIIAGVGVAIAGFAIYRIVKEQKRKRKKQEDLISELHRINPTLQKMEKRLLELAKREKNKDFDTKRYLEANREINETIWGIVPDKSVTVEEARIAGSKIESSMRDKYGSEAVTSEEGLKKLLEVSLVLDNRGFGLKEQKEKDKKYLKLNSQISEIRSSVMVNAELNNLIKRHILFSEMAANMLLAIYKDIRIRAKVQDAEYSIMDFVSLPIQAGIEGLERFIKEFLSKIRAEIGECIRELEEATKNG